MDEHATKYAKTIMKLFLWKLTLAYQGEKEILKLVFYLLIPQFWNTQYVLYRAMSHAHLSVSLSI